jgi:hypothetical protein
MIEAKLIRNGQSLKFGTPKGVEIPTFIDSDSGVPTIAARDYKRNLKAATDASKRKKEKFLEQLLQKK